MTTIRAEANRRRTFAIAAIGEPQFEPARHALARRTDTSCRQALAGRKGVEIATRTYRTLLDVASRDLPEITLNPVIDI